MNMPAKTVGLVFQEMQPVLDTFRRNYIKVLEAALKRFEVGKLGVCRVYIVISVIMPCELTFDLRQLELVVIHFSNDFRRPVF